MACLGRRTYALRRLLKQVQLIGSLAEHRHRRGVVLEGAVDATVADLAEDELRRFLRQFGPLIDLQHELVQLFLLLYLDAEGLYRSYLGRRTTPNNVHVKDGLGVVGQRHRQRIPVLEVVRHLLTFRTLD